jgi:cytochrome c-type protein NapB
MIKKEFLMALSVSVLLLGGCVDSSTGASARADMEGGESHKVEKKAETPAPKVVEKKVEEKKAQTPAPKVVEKKVEEKKAQTPAPKAEEPKSEEKATTQVNTTACAGCHGANFEKKAMGVSKVVKDLSKADIVKALKGYKDGSYGGAMKGIMKGQAGPLSDAQIEAIANKIGK